MSTEEHRFPRQLLHPVCADNAEGVRSAGSPHHHDDEDCATLDSQMAWNLIVNRAALNADMLVRDAHTDAEFVWTFERHDLPSDDELREARLALVETQKTIARQVAVIDVALNEDGA